MPHLIIEHDGQLTFNGDQLIAHLNQALVDSGHFGEIDIKTRLYMADHARIGTVDEPRSFLHCTLRLMPGRSSTIQQELAQLLVSTIDDFLAPSPTINVHITAETVELNTPHYAKIIR